MITKRFLSPKEEYEIAKRTMTGSKSLEDLVPHKTIKISENCARIAEDLGPIAEQELGFHVEYYTELLREHDDPVIRDIFIPTQDNSAPGYFEPSMRMMQEFMQFLKYKREKTGRKWIPAGSAHGHGRALVCGETELTFSREDIEYHIDNYLRTQSVFAREILSEPKDLSIMLNSMEFTRTDSGLMIHDEFVYHPVIDILGLDETEQEEALSSIGIDLKNLNGNDTLDIIIAHLKAACIKAGSENTSAISAKQYRIRGYNYFIVYDNDKNHRSMIGIAVEDTVSHTVRTHLKELPLEIIAVEDDIPYDKEMLREKVRQVYQNQIEQQRRLRMSTLQTMAYEHIRHHKKSGLTKVSYKKEEFKGHITPEEAASLFFHSAQSYLDLCRFHDHPYSQLLSYTLEHITGHDTDNTEPLCMIVAQKHYADTGKDTDTVHIAKGFDTMKDHIVSGILHGLEISPDRDLDTRFMLDFSCSATVDAKNKVIERYLHDTKTYQTGDLKNG